MTGDDYVPDAGDLVWLDFNPALGHEQGGRWPALVVSPRALAEATGFCIVCPITSNVRPFPTSVVLPDHLPVTGEILLHQMRSIDMKARHVRHAGAVGAETAAEARRKLAALITI